MSKERDLKENREIAKGFIHEDRGDKHLNTSLKTRM
ncbi:hypothetical protein PI23P_06815 [Polaribacter irgensii 23-P]|uniref:Uncharacterized protein n=1 Tax=Polaribacter irgensii 23-P TaxID=313594 RepID=A4BYS2_9FLAO|nr:hypothetical protein PI23P_06815 [Polaribacter irgensii 23-P]